MIADQQTNILIFDVADAGRSAADCVAALRAEGLLCLDVGPSRIRLVTHRDVNTEQITAAAEALTRVFGG